MLEMGKSNAAIWGKLNWVGDFPYVPNWLDSMFLKHAQAIQVSAINNSKSCY